jgi:hypothetical protein
MCRSDIFYCVTFSQVLLTGRTTQHSGKGTHWPRYKKKTSKGEPSKEDELLVKLKESGKLTWDEIFASSLQQ